MCKHWYESQNAIDLLMEYCRLSNKPCDCWGDISICDYPDQLKERSLMEYKMNQDKIAGATYLLLRGATIVNTKQYALLSDEIDLMQKELDKETDVRESLEQPKEGVQNDSGENQSISK